MEIYQKILLWVFVTWLYAITFAHQVEYFTDKLKNTNNKKRITQWIIFSALFGLTLYVYVAHLLLFR